jgi:SAM-dependent methyltransferase
MIPNIIHFIFGLRQDLAGTQFSFIHYLAIKSADECNKPAAINFYYKHEPSGEWWEKSKRYLTLIKIEPPTEIFGNPLMHYAHQADVLRLEIILKQGGIYLDMDVVCLNSFKPLLKYDCVMGLEGKKGLCNAVILAKPNAEFIKKWYEEYATFKSKGRDKLWVEHSVITPLRIARKNPKIIHIEDKFSFFWPTVGSPELLWLTDSLEVNLGYKRKFQNWGKWMILSNSYCKHLWSSLWWNDYLQDLTPECIEKSNNNFSRLYRKFLTTSESKKQRKPLAAFSRFLIKPSLFCIKKSFVLYGKFDKLKTRSQNNKRRTNMSVQEIFTEIYNNKLWGDNGLNKFYSGPGSTEESVAQPYIQKISDFLKAYIPKKPRIVDLGCGNFEIGKHFIDYCSEYIGVDIVPKLIEELNKTKATSSVKFLCLDIIDDELPGGDIAFLRQVLQHLSNEQILMILSKLRKYKIVFITEHYPTPNPDVVPNKNITSGVGIRLSKNSGVYLDKMPFDISKHALQFFLEVPGAGMDKGQDQGVIQTYKLEFSVNE